MAILLEVSPGISFVLRALSRTVLFSAALTGVTTRSLGEIGNTAIRLFCTPGGLALLLVFGLSFAGLPLILHRPRQRKWGKVFE